MSTLVQKAFGVGSATFANPTQVGSSIIVIYAVNDGSGFLAPTDDKLNTYQQDASLVNVSPNGDLSAFCTVWYCPPGAGVPINTGVLTVTGHADPFSTPHTPPFVWIYEVVTNQVLPSSNAHPAAPKDIAGQNFGPADLNPVGTDIGPVGNNSTNPSATGDFCLAICLVEGGTVTSVDAPWTLDTVQGGNAPAYAFFANGIHAFPQFHQAMAVNWAVGMSYYTADVVVSTGTIRVNKVTNPTSASQAFTFHPSWNGGTPFTLTNGQFNNSGPLPPGTYSLTEDSIAGWTMTASVSNGSPLNAISVSAGENVVINVLNTQAIPVSPCAPTDGSGNPVNGVFVPDLGLFIIPATALYNDLIPNAALKSSESTAEGRHSIIVDFNNNEGTYARDLGTIFTWDLQSDTILDVWQPSIIPLDGEVYDRLSFHCLMTSLNNVGWQHAREMNISHASQADLTLLLTFDQWPNIVVTVPNSGGQEIKQKVTLPPNKFKLVEVFISSTLPFKLWASDLEMKIGQWGRSDAYRVLKPVSA